MLTTISYYCLYLYNLCANTKERRKNIKTASQKERDAERERERKEREELRTKEEQEEREIISLKQEIESYKNRCNERDIEIDNLYTELEALREKNAKLQRNLEKIVHYINFLLDFKKELLT